jgi:hypothetical protein
MQQISINKNTENGAILRWRLFQADAAPFRVQVNAPDFCGHMWFM